MDVGRVSANYCDSQPKILSGGKPPPLLSNDRGRTFAGIVAALQAAGYGVDWKTISAGDLGAPHRRERVFMVARKESCVDQVRVLRGVHLHDSSVPRSRLRVSADRGVGRVSVQAADDMADAVRSGLEGPVVEHAGEGLPRPRRGTRRDETQEVSDSTGGWWQAQPKLGRVAHGIPHRVDRLRCLGNAVVPQAAEVVGKAIMQAYP